jgi:hypothetical protein
MVSYLIDWKGENFYSGNHILNFMGTGEALRNWLQEQRKKGIRAIYLVTAYHGINWIQGELSPGSHVESITGSKENNKFMLIRLRFNKKP